MLRCYNRAVRRFVFAIIVATLTFSASGVVGLVTLEPCTANEAAGNDGACPPTCVTCGCCAQAAEPAALIVSCAPDDPLSEVDTPLPHLPGTEPRDILHVPKRLPA